MGGECMAHTFDYLVHLLSLTWVFPGLKVVSTLSCPFLDSYGVMGFILGWALDCQKLLEPSEVVLGKSQVLGVEMVFSGKSLISGWRQENSSRYGEGTPRHLSLVWFCDLKTCLGEITIDWGWRWFNLWIPYLVMSLSHEIPHSCWNMARGWLDERKFWFNPIYGWVVCGSPWHGWLLHKLIRVIFLLWTMSTCTCYYVDFMSDLSWFLLWLYVGYKHGSMMCSNYASCS